LEEVVEADLVLHLRDISDPDTAAQAEDVERILGDLGVDAADTSRVIEVWNKIDLLDEGNRERLLVGSAGGKAPPIAISAATGEGIDALKALIETRVSGELETMTVTLSPAQLGQVDWLYRNGDVVSRTDNEDGSVTLSLTATHSARQEIESRLHRKTGS
ncbi:GTPase HflX, partial [Mesorhizobium sp. M1E.F.Ca.ET.063.01.1.1]